MSPATVQYDSIISAVEVVDHQINLFLFSVVHKMFIFQRKKKHLSIFALTALLLFSGCHCTSTIAASSASAASEAAPASTALANPAASATTAAAGATASTAVSSYHLDYCRKIVGYMNLN